MNKSEQPILVYPQYLNNEEDEINLFEVFHELVAKKWLILSITALFAIASTVYISFTPKLWQTSIEFMPPSLENIEDLTIQNVNDSLEKDKGVTNILYRAEIVYEKYIESLQDTSLKRQFFDQYEVLKLDIKNTPENKSLYKDQNENTFQIFNHSFTVNRLDKTIITDTKKRLSLYKSTLTFTSSFQKEVKHILSGYADYTKEYVLNKILSTITKQVKQKIIVLERRILYFLEKERKQKNTQLLLLDESIQIAKKLGIKDFKLDVAVSTNTPLYFRGYKALEMEKKILLERKSNRHFIVEIDDLESTIVQISTDLDSLLKNKKNLLVVSIVKKAQAPVLLKASKNKLIVIVSTLLGFIFSLFLIFFLSIKQKYQEKYAHV